MATADSTFDKITEAINNPERLPVFIPSVEQGRVAKPEVWTPLDPWQVFSFLPPERLQVYVQRTARRLEKSGWIIAPANNISWWENLYAAAYDITDKKDFTVPALPDLPPLTAIRLAPKHLKTEP